MAKDKQVKKDVNLSKLREMLQECSQTLKEIRYALGEFLDKK